LLRYERVFFSWGFFDLTPGILLWAELARRLGMHTPHCKDTIVQKTHSRKQRHCTRMSYQSAVQRFIRPEGSTSLRDEAVRSQFAPPDSLIDFYSLSLSISSHIQDQPDFYHKSSTTKEKRGKLADFKPCPSVRLCHVTTLTESRETMDSNLRPHQRSKSSCARESNSSSPHPILYTNARPQRKTKQAQKFKSHRHHLSITSHQTPLKRSKVVI
jgi:hypothetical protein